MRIKVILPIVLITIAVIVAVVRSKHSAPPPAPVTIAPTTNSPAVPPAIALTKPVSNGAPNKPFLTVHPHVNTNGMSAHDLYISKEIDKLSQLQANDDAGSLHEILNDLTNSEKAIRDAALESTIQFASRDAVPYLRNLAANTSDPQEKTNLIEAADYLELPSWTEIHQQNPNARLGKTTPADGSSPNGLPSAPQP